MGALSGSERRRFAAGCATALYRCFGAHPDPSGCSFTLWAPPARAVRVVGEVAPRGRSLRRRRGGIWTVRIPEARPGQTYCFIVEDGRGKSQTRADPFAAELVGATSPQAIVPRPARRWRDGAWMRGRAERQALDRPMSVYEVHLGSWRRAADGGFLGYREAARQLAEYAAETGFTHVELLPLAEHPFYGSWGYQATGYFAPSCRYGRPDDLRAAIETLHRAGIGVILDWVPSHFPSDSHGLFRFAGEALYEHPDRRKGHHPDWDSAVFNYESGEVRSFLLSSARWWLERFHIDALRIDAVASMLYLDYSRGPGEWLPNEHGGNEYLAAIELLRSLNRMVHAEFPGVLVIAEESSAWPGVTRAEYLGGLGFDLKWDMGWMNDTLRYLRRDPIHRRHHHNELSFRMLYAHQERFMLALSHDEVVHEKGSLAGKMPGSKAEKLAQLRLLLGYMWGLPGKKLLFMGGEIGQWAEWSHDRELDWRLLERREHRGVRRWVAALNRLLVEQPPLHELDFEPDGFGWVDADDSEHSLYSFVRRDRDGGLVLAVANFTPVARRGKRLGVPVAGRWRTLLNSDDRRFGGSGTSPGRLFAEAVPAHGFAASLTLDVPAFALVFAAPVGRPARPPG